MRMLAATAVPPLRGLLPLAVLLAIWQAAGSEQSPYFPPPSQWTGALADLWNSGVLLPSAGATFVSFIQALVAATVSGTVLGLLVGMSRPIDAALGPTLEFARALPPASVVPIATLLIGYDERMKVAVVTFAGVWPILLNTRAGVRALDPVVIDTARVLHLGRLDRARKVILPALLPAVFLGMRVAIPLALVVTLLVEYLTQVEGIGALIGAAQRSYESAAVYGLILLTGLFSLIVNALLAVLEAYALRHRPR